MLVDSIWFLTLAIAGACGHTGAMQDGDSRIRELFGVTREELDCWRSYTKLTHEDLEIAALNTEKALKALRERGDGGLQDFLDQLYPGTTRNSAKPTPEA